MNTMQILMILIIELKFFKRKLRKHSKGKIRKIAKSIQELGFLVPILIDENNRVLAGEAVIEAAKLLGYDAVPAIRHTHLTEAKKKAFRTAHNKLSEGSPWDLEALRLEFQDIIVEAPELDLTITGFDAPQIDNLLGFKVEGTGELDEPVGPEVIEQPVSRRGDVWVIGNHRLLCGDATAEKDYTILLGDDKARMVLTDPPYNVKIQGNVSGLGKNKHREFVEGSGEKSKSQFCWFLFDFFIASRIHSLDGSLYYIFMDGKHLLELQLAAYATYLETLNIISWVKTNAGMGSMYRSQQEFVLVAKAASKPEVAHVNNVQLGAHGRNRTTVWNYAGVNSFGKGRDEALAMHPTVKPTDMLADAILDASHKGEIILDPFGGSGSTMVAAEHVGRHARMMELDPIYVDTIIMRMQKTFGLEAIHEEAGLSFNELASARANDDKEADHG